VPINSNTAASSVALGADNYNAAIDVSDLMFSYTGREEDAILRIDSWQLECGQHLFLYGPSGSGKSTLLNLLSGILTPQRGSVSLLGQPFSSLSSRKRDRFRALHIGVVFQQFNLVPYLSVLDNVRLAARFGKLPAALVTTRVKTLFERLLLDSTLLDRRADTLSVGQQQRVAIARSLINGPEILIADEPTSALDSDARDNFIGLLLECAALYKSTLIFVSHDRALARHFSGSADLCLLNAVQDLTHAD